MAGTFEPIYYSYQTEYPESGVRIQFGNSYTFTAPPDAPDQRIFKLTLQGMQYFVDSNGTLNRTINPTRNMAKLEDFYIANKLWDTFTLNHPVYGTLSVKFNKPLRIPDGVKGGGGVIPNFEIELIEQP